MKKVLIYLTIILLSLKTFAAEIRFIQVTDVHLTKNNSKYLEEFVKDVNQDFQNLDFIIFTGDNIDEANPNDLWNFASIIKKLKVKPYVVLGNHDLRHDNSMTSSNYMYLIKRKLGFYHSSKPNYVFQKGNIIFIVMNGVKEFMPAPNGYYNNEELRWLDKQLTKYKDNKVVIFQHFPLLPSKILTHNLWKQEEYIKVLKKHSNVISIISGHYHKNQEVKIDGIYNIITKNFSNNKYYKLITIDDEDGFISTSLIEN